MATVGVTAGVVAAMADCAATGATDARDVGASGSACGNIRHGIATISSSDAADTAVVLDQTAAEPLSLADRFGDFLTSIVEYFR